MRSPQLSRLPASHQAATEAKQIGSSLYLPFLRPRDRHGMRAATVRQSQLKAALNK
jgi:hypothetical protein